MSEVACPHCSNQDKTLLEPRILWQKTLWLCLVCSKVFTEDTSERKDVKRPIA